MRGLLRTAYVRRITVQYLTVLLYDGNAETCDSGLNNYWTTRRIISVEELTSRFNYV